MRAQTGNKPIRIAVDLRDATKYIFHAKLEFPVKEGALTLVYPKWIPGDHAPTGPILDLTGLKFRAGGKEIAWLRDDVDMYAFHCDIPAGMETLEVSLDYLSPNTVQSVMENPGDFAACRVELVFGLALSTRIEERRFDLRSQIAAAGRLEVRNGFAYCKGFRG